MIWKLNSVLKLKKRIGILENKMDEENDVPTNERRERKASICNNTCKDSLVRARLTEMIALKCEISQLNEWNDCFVYSSSSSSSCLSLCYVSFHFARLFLHQIPFIFILSVLFELIKFKRCREKKFNKLYA